VVGLFAAACLVSWWFWIRPVLNAVHPAPAATADLKQQQQPVEHTPARRGPLLPIINDGENDEK
jgi:hypothetical protein